MPLNKRHQPLPHRHLQQPIVHRYRQHLQVQLFLERGPQHHRCMPNRRLRNLLWRRSHSPHHSLQQALQWAQISDKGHAQPLRNLALLLRRRIVQVLHLHSVRMEQMALQQPQKLNRLLPNKTHQTGQPTLTPSDQRVHGHKDAHQEDCQMWVFCPDDRSVLFSRPQQ